MAARGRPADAQHRRMRTLLSTLAARGGSGATRRQLMVLMGKDPDNAGHVRAFFRDLENLQQAGWRIASVKVAGEDRYVLTVIDHRLRAAFTDQERAQLLRAAQRAGIGQVYEDLEPALPDGTPAPAEGELDIVQRAIASRCLLTFSYSGRDRLVHPYDLSHRPGGWIMRGREDDSQVVKWFYLNRMVDPDLDRPGTAERVPAGLPAANLDPMRWQQHDPVQVEVEHTEAELADVITALGVNGYREVPGAPGGQRRTAVTVTHMDAFIDRVLELGTRVRVAGPEQARDALRNRLTAGVDS